MKNRFSTRVATSVSETAKRGEQRAGLPTLGALISTLLAVSLFFGTPAAHAQEKDLIAVMPQTIAADLNPGQVERLNKIKQRATAASVDLIRLNVDTLLSDTTNVTLPNVKALKFARKSVERRSERDFTWHGGLPGLAGSATLIVHDNNVTGTIRNDSALYRIESLGNGVHALIKVDESRFPPDEPPTLKEKSGAADTHSRQASASDASPNGGPVGIEVLVAYTTSAKAAVSDINATIQLAVAEANQSYINSNINIKLNLVDSFEVSYSESGKSFDTILADFVAMHDVQKRRDSSGADMSVMIINQSDFCGLADAILAGASTAYAIVHYDCATGYYSFAHELGHLMGARHDPANDSTSTPFAYGHGFQNTATPSWRTVMAYNCPGGCPRLQYWSNPNVGHNGVAMGTASLSDNARVLNETAATMDAFRGEGVAGLPGYVRCAVENQTCSFPGTRNVAYGADGKFAFRMATNGIACNNATFGDPNFGRIKSCYMGLVGYFYCAPENGNCSFSGTRNVAYGANGKFAFRMATNGSACNNATFGDPNFGTVKACYIGLEGYSYCAPENGNCSFSGTRNVGYGANGKFAFQMATNGVACNNATFGDPIVGTVKACYIGLEGYSYCAPENGNCRFDGTRSVAYGANGKFAFRMLTPPPPSSTQALTAGPVIAPGIACNNATFGDPNFGTVKACYVGLEGYSYCGPENGNCSFSGTRNVAYGADAKFVFKTATNGITCNNATFGDPIFGVVKACYVK